ncbi:MAG TPA: phenylalanine 4-monooxygenase, partial [Terriglobales bacterium]
MQTAVAASATTLAPVPVPPDEAVSVWRTLYERRIQQLRHCASRVFLEGMHLIRLTANAVPTLSGVNAQLMPLTGWQAVETQGFLPAADFFEALSHRKFPTVTRVRKASELDYTPEPDIFHDVFGHVPMHSNTNFADFLQRFGDVAARCRTERERQRMTRLFWFTVEFGLIREDGRVKVYGSGLVSSHGECTHALSPDCLRRKFDLIDVMEQPFRHDEIQPVLFVIESFSQLFDAAERAERMLASGLLDQPSLRNQ